MAEGDLYTRKRVASSDNEVWTYTNNTGNVEIITSAHGGSSSVNFSVGTDKIGTDITSQYDPNGGQSVWEYSKSSIVVPDGQSVDMFLEFTGRSVALTTQEVNRTGIKSDGVITSGNTVTLSSIGFSDGDVVRSLQSAADIPFEFYDGSTWRQVADAKTNPATRIHIDDASQWRINNVETFGVSYRITGLRPE